MHCKSALEMFQGRTNTVNVLTDLNNWNKLLYPFCFSPSNLGTDFHYWRTVLGARWHFGKANRQIGNRSLIWIPQRDWGHKFKRKKKDQFVTVGCTTLKQAKSSLKLMMALPANKSFRARMLGSTVVRTADISLNEYYWRKTWYYIYLHTWEAMT